MDVTGDGRMVATLSNRSDPKDRNVSVPAPKSETGKCGQFLVERNCMTKTYRYLSEAQKRAAVARVAAGEAVSTVARSIEVNRNRLYEWCTSTRKVEPRRCGGLVGRARRRAWERGLEPGKTGWMSCRRRAGRSPSCNARSASSRLISIFFAKPCGISRRHGGRRPHLAALRLPSHRSDDSSMPQGSP